MEPRDRLALAMLAFGLVCAVVGIMVAYDWPIGLIFLGSGSAALGLLIGAR